VRLGAKGLFYWFKQSGYESPFVNYPYLTFFKDLLQGDLSIIHPDNTNKMLLHEPSNPNNLKDGVLYEANQFSSSPSLADTLPELPPYANLFTLSVNYTDENVAKLSKNNFFLYKKILNSSSLEN
jgi:hypothetical protein